jgi:hypothetical protein
MIRTVGTTTAGQKVFFWIYAIPVVLYSAAFFIAGAAKPDAVVIVCSLLFPLSTLLAWSPVIVRLRRRQLPLTWGLILWTGLLGPFAFLISRGR